MSAWRPARRMAVRSIRRNLGRSILIALLIGLPVAVATFGDVLFRSTNSPATHAYLNLGGADAKLVVTPDKRIEDFTLTSENYGFGYRIQRDPSTVDVARLLPRGTRVERMGTDGGQGLLLRHGRRYDEVALGERTMPSLFQPERLQLRAGTFPGAGEVALTQRTADRLGAGPGDTVTDDLTRTHLVVSGIVRDEQCLRCAGAYIQPGQSVVPAEQSASDYQWDGVQTAYLVDLPPGTSANALAHRLADQGVLLYPRDTYLHPDDYDPDHAWSRSVSLDEVRAAALTTLIVGLGLLEVILLAGAAFAVGARKQVREMGLISAEGGSPRQLRTVLLAQGAALGLLGTFAGVVTGLVVARLGWPLWEQLNGSVIPVYRFGPEIGIAVVVGVASGVLAAVVPAIGAARKQPLDALSGRFRVTRERSRRTTVIGGLLVLTGVLLGLLGSAQMASDFHEYAEVLATVRQTGTYVSAPSPTLPIALILLGAVLIIAGLVLTMPLVLGTLGRLGSRLPLPGRLAVRDADRHRHRTGPATSAIMLAIAGSVVSAFAISGAARAEEARWTPQLPAHTMQIGASYPAGPEEQAAEIAAAADRAAAAIPGSTVLPQTDLGYQTSASQQEEGAPAVQQVWFNPHLECTSNCVMTGSSGSAAVADPALVRMLLGRDLTGTESAALDRGEALALSPSLVDGDGKISTSFDGQTDDPTLSLPARVVNGVPYYGSMPRVLISAATASRSGLVVVPTSRLVSYPADATKAQVRAALNAASSDRRAGASVDWPADPQDQVPLVVVGLVAGLITLIGVAIAVALSAAEGRRELATLAAVGAAPRVRRQLAGAQALVISGVGAAVGVALGCFVAYALRATFGAPSFTVPWANLAAVGLGVPVLSALVAATFTRSRVPVLERRA